MGNPIVSYTTTVAVKPEYIFKKNASQFLRHAVQHARSQSEAKLMHDASIRHEQGFRIHKIINKIFSFMIKNDIVQWIENSGGWERIDF